MKGIPALILIILLTLLMRSTALTALAARGIVFDVLVCATVLWAMRYHESWGASFGFALGLAADLDAAHWLGRHALALTLIGYAVGRLSHTLVRNSARTQAVLLVVATLIHQTWAASFELGGLGGWPYLLKRVLLAAATTAPLGTLFFALLGRASGRSPFSHAAVEADPAG